MSLRISAWWKRSPVGVKAAVIMSGATVAAAVLHAIVQWNDGDPKNDAQTIAGNAGEVTAIQGSNNTINFGVNNLERDALVERASILEKTDYSSLVRRYPGGYYLVASNRYASVPANSHVAEQLALDWENSLIQPIDGKLFRIVLKKFEYKPTHIEIKDLHVLLEPKGGAVATGIRFDGWQLFVELIEVSGDLVTFVVGLGTEQAFNPEIRLKFDIAPYLGGENWGFGPSFNFGDKKWVTLSSWTITSAWETPPETE